MDRDTMVDVSSIFNETLHSGGDWQQAIRELASRERPSASDGERDAAHWIADRLQQLGCQTRVEQQQAHGGYWWPIGLANAAAAAAGLSVLRRTTLKQRLLAATVAGAAAAAVHDDLEQRRRWLRRLLPKRPTYNVIAETGDPDAELTLIVVAHHDAAHSGLVFHPAFGKIGPKLFPAMHERSKHTLPILYAVWLGPVAISLGAVVGCKRLLTAGLLFSAGAGAAMANIGASSVVPGANDNLSAVGTLIALAAEQQRRPLKGARVLLVSTGSEESFSEGMQGFVDRHRGELDPARTELLCLECLGGETLSVLEGEGMLRIHHYPQHMRDALADAADRAGVAIARGLETVAATDALAAQLAGYQVVTLASVDATKLPRNYHWPSDTPDGLTWSTIEDAIRVCDEFLRARAERSSLNAKE
jgi:hypothetical protein